MKAFPTALASLFALGLITAAPLAAAKPGKDPSSIPEPANVTEERARLNAEQAEIGRKRAEANAASAKAYEEALRAQQEAAAKAQAEYEARLKKWQEDVAACKAGDVRRCAG